MRIAERFNKKKPQKVQAVALIPKMFLVAVLMVIRVDSWAKQLIYIIILFMILKNLDKTFITIAKFRSTSISQYNLFYRIHL